MGEKSLPQTQRCDTPMLRTEHVCTFKFPWTYSAAGKTPLPAEQINRKAPRKVELLDTILPKSVIHCGTCQRMGHRAKA